MLRVRPHKGPPADVQDGELDSSIREVGIAWELWIISISDADESFTVELDLKYTWIARGFAAQYAAAGSPHDRSERMGELIAKCWMPYVHVNNVHEEIQEVSEKVNCVDPTTGRMHCFSKVRCKCSETLELHRFPFDRQWLTVHIGTYRDIGEVVFVPYPGRPCFNNTRASRWTLKHTIEPMLIVPDPQSAGLVASSGRSYHRCFISIEAERDFWWYVMHFILPHMVILMMNANVIIIPRNEVGDRNSVTLTLLLTTVAFQFLLVPEVPKKRYVTILDGVMNLGLLVQLASCAIVFLHADLPTREGETRVHMYEVTDQKAEEVERLFLSWVIGGWVLVNVSLVLAVWAFEVLENVFPWLHSMSPVDQDWILSALGQNAATPARGSFLMHRMGKTHASSRCTIEPFRRALIQQLVE
ncbi:hypothetical protein KFE25_012315 [Diacronema lutheri]|uniref:Neurotransmitter-gated ion-channel ligand-binding domain-containing protein n=2 Tax=Diacronema lutheri TaxID=2081491 RepID=A0A8J5XIP8_DIALT|nr:hypothetical protein KFE25_012315 [Diacronema lutheri]